MIDSWAKRASHAIRIAPKVCSSGHEHREIPANALFSEMGFFWTCYCGTTLMLPFSSIGAPPNDAPESDLDEHEIFLGGGAT